MRVIFVATGDISLPSFRHLLEHGPRPLALVTQPDKPVGRHQTLTPPQVKVEALAAGIPVLQPEKISSITDELAALRPEVMVVVAYGQLLGKATRNIASLATINLHASLLPRHRGASCIQAAIDAGDAETGITAMHVVRELDAGDIIMARRLTIGADETGGALHDRLALLAPEVLEQTLAGLAGGTAMRTPQDAALSTYAPKLERGDGRIDWSAGAAQIERRIRAYDPWPGTFTHVCEGGAVSRLKVFPPVGVLEGVTFKGLSLDEGRLVIGCGDGAVELHEVQAEGGKRMSARDYLRGRKPDRVE
jgi:methionyl-tRNA formyltransferase